MAAFTDIFITCMVHPAKKHAHVMAPGIPGFFCILKKIPLQMDVAFPVACPEMICCRFVVMDKGARIFLKDSDPAERFKVLFCTAAVKHVILCAEIPYICPDPVCCHNSCIRAYFPGIEYGILNYRPYVCTGSSKAAAEIKVLCTEGSRNMESDPERFR